MKRFFEMIIAYFIILVNEKFYLINIKPRLSIIQYNNVLLIHRSPRSPHLLANTPAWGTLRVDRMLL